MADEKDTTSAAEKTAREKEEKMRKEKATEQSTPQKQITY